jgi:hypothetical protein
MAVLSVCYAWIVLLPFFRDGIYKMHDREIWELTYGLGTPGAQEACLLFECLLAPLLFMTSIDLLRTWARRYHEPRNFFFLKLGLFLFFLAIVVISWVNRYYLYSWAIETTVPWR